MFTRRTRCIRIQQKYEINILGGEFHLANCVKNYQPTNNSEAPRRRNGALSPIAFSRNRFPFEVSRFDFLFYMFKGKFLGGLSACSVGIDPTAVNKLKLPPHERR